MSDLTDIIADELAQWEIGRGYYATPVGHEEALEMAKAVLAVSELAAALRVHQAVMNTELVVVNAAGYVKVGADVAVDGVFWSAFKFATYLQALGRVEPQ